MPHPSVPIQTDGKIVAFGNQTNTQSAITTRTLAPYVANQRSHQSDVD
jgi:hypothetical protein